MKNRVKTRVLFVCMGNICRSPTAEGVVRTLLDRAGLLPEVEIDSAGTHDYHIGKPPDERARTAAAGRGYDLSALRARRVSEFDFVRFDRILAMDRDNLDLLRQACPAEHRHKLGLFLEYSRKFGEREVPDPYYGGAEGFERVLDLVEDAASGLIDSLPRK
nr:low molecular weight protein-tyrosine-phosphatase [Sulfurisoma sediminicola]